MKPQIKCVLCEVQKLEDNYYKVWVDYHYDNNIGTIVTKEVSFHSSQQEAEDQRTINKFNILGL